MRNITIATFWAISATFIAHGANPGDSGEEPWRDVTTVKQRWDIDVGSYVYVTNAAYKDYTHKWSQHYNCRTCVNFYGLDEHDPDLKQKDSPNYTPRYIPPYTYTDVTNESGVVESVMTGTEDMEFANSPVGHAFMHNDGDVDSDSDLPYILVRMGHVHYGQDSIIWQFDTNNAPDYLEYYESSIFGNEMTLGYGEFAPWSVVTVKVMFSANERLPEFIQSGLDAGNYNFRLVDTQYSTIDYSTPSEEPIGFTEWHYLPENYPDESYINYDLLVTNWNDNGEYIYSTVMARKYMWGYAEVTTTNTYGKIYWIESHLGGTVHRINFNDGGDVMEYGATEDPDRHITEWDFASDDPRIKFMAKPDDAFGYRILSTTNLLTGVWDLEASLPVTFGDKVISYPVDVEPDVKFFKLQGQTENIVGYNRFRIVGGSGGGGVPTTP